MYVSHNEQPCAYDNWNGQMPQVAAADSGNGAAEDLGATFNHQMDMNFPVSDYNCGLDQSQMYNDHSSCGMENQDFSLTDEMNLPLDISQY